MSDYQAYLDGEVDILLAECGEEITYKPLSGQERTITALVDRNAPSRTEGDLPSFGPVFTILVANDAASGISSAEVDTGGDVVGLAQRQGDASDKQVDRRITKIVTQNPEFCKYELQ